MSGRCRGRLLIAALAAAAGLCAPVAPAHAGEVRRLALLIANSRGGAGTAALRYARQDAEKLGAVLLELGGYLEADLHFLFDADADQARRALGEVEARLARAKAEGAQTSLLVYYSGHARDGALRLGDSRWPMVELRGALSRSAADVRLGVIDACQSGAITRLKGGRPGPSFLFDAQDGQPARGLVLISSSSDDESSQESDEIGGSYFTHYLTSGLRGDADESGDRRITLGEVYSYAYNKTIQETVTTRSGVQHPTYSYDLQGSGNLILTDLSMGRSAVVFPAHLAGDYLIFDRVREQVAAEIHKVSGQPRRIALAPGDYVIKRRLPDHLRLAQFALADRADYTVDESLMRDVAFEDDYAKGLVLDDRDRLSVGFELRMIYQSFLDANTRAVLVPPVLLLGGGFDLGGVVGATIGLDVLFGGRGAQALPLEGLEIGYNFFEAQVGLEMLWTLGGDRLAMIVGPRVAGIYLRRSFLDDPRLADYVQDHFGVSPALVGGLRYRFDDAGRFEAQARMHLGLLSFGVDENRALFYAEGGMSMGMRW